MAKGKELNAQLLARDPRFNYIPPEDHYLFAREDPKYKFNVIGTGINGSEQIPFTLMEGRASIHGIYDPNPGSVESARALFKDFEPGQELPISEGLEAACSDPNADGLIMATPKYTHLEVLRVAVKSGKHILFEKPMPTTIQDA